MAHWSSLPPELVSHIADCFLATNDLDYYMDFRSVCSNWRSATDDPKNFSELRFRPRRWLIIRDQFGKKEPHRLVNTVTGRVLHKDLPLLRNYIIVATTHGGYFVLADRKAPHGVGILNPLTGHIIRFMAPLPSSRMDDVLAAVSGSSPTLILISGGAYEDYKADPASESFSVCERVGISSVTNILAVNGGVYADGVHGSVATIPFVVEKISELIAIVFDRPNEDVYGPGRCRLAEFAGEVFLVIRKTGYQFHVFKVNNDRQVFEPVNGIGNLAIFIGYRRGFAVDASKLRTIDANCIYYLKSRGAALSTDIRNRKYDLKDEKEEMISDLFYPESDHTILHYLSGHTMDVQDYLVD